MIIGAVRAAGLFEEVIDQRLQGFVWLGRIEPGQIQHIQHPTNSSQISQDLKKLLGWAGIAVGRSQGLVWPGSAAYHIWTMLGPAGC